MSALPRPDLPPGSQRELSDALHELHHRAGWPSLRTLGRAAACSPSTVSAAFSSPRLPTWGTLELLVEAMDGDTVAFKELWLAASARTAGAPVGGPEPRIAGRKAELAVVRRHLEAGTGVLVVAGEAGMGKTRLVATATALAAERTFVAVGSCLPLSTEVPLLPIAEVLRAVHQADQGQWMKEALADAPDYVAASLSRLLPEVAQLATVTDPDDDWSRQRLFAAVTTTLGALAALRPLAVVVEDLHWADATTLDLLEHVIATPGHLSVLGTWRLDDPDTSSATHDWWTRIRRSATVTTCALVPMTRDETAEQLGLLRGGAVDSDAVDLIHDRSQGQPLFTEQLAARRESADQLPRLLADVLEQQLAGLGAEAWSIAGTLGVADRPLTDAQLRDVTGLSAEAVLDGLHELDGRRVLAQAGTELQLRHPLLAEAARQRMLVVDRTDLHRRLATTLGEAADPSAAEVAEHWRAAGDREDELVWRIAAANAAGARYAWAVEGSQWRRVLELWPHPAKAAGRPPVRLCDVYIRAMDALQSINLEAAAELAEEALPLTATLEPADAAAIWARAGDYLHEVGDPARGLALVERALAVYETLPPSQAQVRALLRVHGVLHSMGRYGQAHDAIRRASEVCVSLDAPGLVFGVDVNLAWYDALTGDLDGGLDAARRAWSRFVPAPLLRSEINASTDFTDLLLRAAAPAEEVASVGGRGLAHAEQWGVDSYAVSVIRVNVSCAWRRSGDVARAAALIDPVTEADPDTDHWALHLERVEIDLRRGRLEEATTRVAAFDAWSFSSIWIRGAISLCSAELRLWLGAAGVACDELVPFLVEVATTDASQDLAPHLVTAARAAADVAERSGTSRGARSGSVRRLVDLLATCRSDPFDPGGGDRAARRALPETWRAELSRLAGAHDVEPWSRAARSWDELVRPHDAAYCRWRAAQAARASGQATLATKLLRRAAVDAREHVPLLEAIRGG